MRLSKDSTPVRRRSSVRCQPYDLRRRVLVKNFMLEQHSPKTEVPYLQQPEERRCELGSDVSDVSKDSDDEQIEIKPICPSDLNLDCSDSSELTTFTAGNNCKNNEDFLYLCSRRLRTSETSRLRVPCRRRSAVLRSSKMRSGDSQESLISRDPSPRKCKKRRSETQDKSRVSSPSRKKVFKSNKKNVKLVPKLKTPENPLRSYPTFDKLNEIVSCDSVTYRKTIEALRTKGCRSPVRSPSPKITPKVKRSHSIRRTLSKIWKRKTSDDKSLTDSEVIKDKTSVTKLERRLSFASKIFSPFSSGHKNRDPEPQAWIDTPRPPLITRSTSFKAPPTPGAPKLKRRAQSVRLKCVRLNNDAF